MVLVTRRALVIVFVAAIVSGGLAVFAFGGGDGRTPHPGRTKSGVSLQVFCDDGFHHPTAKSNDCVPSSP